MRIFKPLVFLMLVAGSSAANSQDARFSMQNTDDGFVKLDSITGMVTECRKKRNKWECAVVNEENPAQRRTDLEDNRLKQDNAKLKERVSGLESKIKELEGKSTKLRLPEDKDLDKLMGFFEKLINKFMDLTDKTQKKASEET